MSENPTFINQVAIEVQLPQTFEKLKINPSDRATIETFLDSLKQKDTETYGHSIRVGLSAREIGKFMHLDEKALFFSGLLHDFGKTEAPAEILRKTEGWTTADSRIIQQHVLDGYKKIKGTFDFTAEIILLHHKFQENEYPEDLPSYLHNYSTETQTLITEHARVLALADTYDALHRKNDKFGEKKELSDVEIKDKMLKLKFCKKELIEGLYEAGVFA